MRRQAEFPPPNFRRTGGHEKPRRDARAASIRSARSRAGAMMRHQGAGFLQTMLSGLRGRILALYALLVVANLAAWAWALVAFRDHPVLLGTAFLAYSLGLRHAVDADHVAAIDNVTRKLMQEGKQPIGAGFFFSLGHSTVVVLASLGIALTATALQARFPFFREVGGLVGTGVSALFLFAVAIANIFILAAVWRAFQRARRGEPDATAALFEVQPAGGLLARILGPLFRFVRASWQMYPLGFLFGLGFDTATEIGLLGISAAEAAKGVSVWTILVFPALFTAGMSLVDTTDSVLMVGAYGWAFRKPIRKLYYNLTITFASVLVALLVGGIETLGLIGRKLGLEGGIWDFVALLGDNFGHLGYVIVGLFAASWLGSMLLYRLAGFDELDRAPERRG
jgi:high-affinity nickel-transport protein